MRLLKTDKKRTYIVLLIIIVQIATMLYFASYKKDYHIDEIYSYVLSNSFDADKISTADWMWDQWINGNEFNEFVTVQENERFAFDKVYYNNSTDCHPPLFYWALHTMCSFFPNQFSKWFGLSLNFLYFAIAGFFIYLISNELITNSKWLKLLPLILYGFSPFAVDTVLFIRMYMMLTMFASVLTYIHIRIFKYGCTVGRAVLTFLIIFLGSMTQYYFIVFSFWSALFCGVYLLRQKKVKQAVIYGVGCIMGVVLMLISYPYAIIQATGSSTNNIGNEVSRNLLNFKLWFHQIKSLGYSIVSRISYVYIVSIAVFVVLAIIMVLLFVEYIKATRLTNTPPMIFWIFFSFAMSFITIAFIGGEYVYLRYILFIIPLIYIFCIIVIDDAKIDNKLVKQVIIVCMCCFVAGNAAVGMKFKLTDYLFTSTHESVQQLKKYKYDKCLVVSDQPSAAISTGNLTRLNQFEKIYMASKKSLVEKGVLQECLYDNEFILYIPTDTYWVRGYISKDLLSELLKGQSVKPELISKGFLGEYYLIK